MLYHVSEESGIELFEPRLAAGYEEAVVWAVREDRLRNYLLPRDCPRVTFFAGARTLPEDREQFLGESAAVVAFEVGWLEQVRRTSLYCYRLPGETFECVDECAGYYHSRRAVRPVGVDRIDDLLGALAARGVEIRMLPSLWGLRDAVVGSTLSYSMIRMRNARGREA